MRKIIQLIARLQRYCRASQTTVASDQLERTFFERELRKYPRSFGCCLKESP